MVAGTEHDLVVPGEVLTAASEGLACSDDVLRLMQARRKNLELVLTGSGAAPDIEQAADLVTEMVPIKHLHTSGLRARQGVEF